MTLSLQSQILPFSGAAAANLCPGCHALVGASHAPGCRFGPGIVGELKRPLQLQGLPIRVRHKTTGLGYLYLGEVLDGTSARDGTRCALYLREGDSGAPTFVCELIEFWANFERVERLC